MLDHDIPGHPAGGHAAGEMRVHLTGALVALVSHDLVERGGRRRKEESEHMRRGARHRATLYLVAGPALSLRDISERAVLGYAHRRVHPSRGEGAEAVGGDECAGLFLPL
jgi:hypothetical protein